MNRSAAGLLAAVACSVLAGCAAASAGVPPSHYEVCQSIAVSCDAAMLKHEPAVLYLSGDGSLWAKDLRWAGWGRSAATGYGTAEENNCTPDCAQGTFSDYPVTITLTRPAPWHGRMVYSSLTYSIPSLSQHFTFSTGLMPAPPPSVPPPSAPPVPGPVSTQATVTGSCAAGYEPAYATAGGVIGYGPFTAGQPSGDVTIGNTQYAPAAAYELTLTNAGSTTAAVDGFVVVFYNSSGQELGSDQERVNATYITAGQSLYWLQSSASDTLGHSLYGNPSGNADYSIPASGFATCQMVEWLHP